MKRPPQIRLLAFVPGVFYYAPRVDLWGFTPGRLCRCGSALWCYELARGYCLPGPLPEAGPECRQKE